MKRIIRLGVFETNSSSTHTCILCNTSSYKKWKNKEYFLIYWEDWIDQNYPEYKKQLIDNWFIPVSFFDNKYFKGTTVPLSKYLKNDRLSDEEYDQVMDYIEENGEGDDYSQREAMGLFTPDTLQLYLDEQNDAILDETSEKFDGKEITAICVAHGC